MDYPQIYDKYKRMVYKIAGKFPYFVQEDLVQEGFFALYRASLSFDPSIASFSSFAYAAIRRSCLNYMRDRAQVVRVPGYLASQGVIVPCIDFTTPTENHSLSLHERIGCSDSDLQRIEDVLSFQRLIKKLKVNNIISEEDFRLLHRRYFQEMTLEEIGKEDGVSRTTVLSRIRKLIHTIRPYFIGTRV